MSKDVLSTLKVTLGKSTIILGSVLLWLKILRDRNEVVEVKLQMTKHAGSTDLFGFNVILHYFLHVV